MQTIEHVTFRLAPGTTREAFLAEARRGEALVRRQSGFRARMLTEGSDGTWSDIVTWDSHAQATTAAETLMADPEFLAFCSLIDAGSVKMTHSALVWQMT
ncbi:MAG: hypothetical protein JNK34_05925 [Tabrizicola sp.]|nr:hypothetical protein [Tabrizicola sp.]